MKYLLKCEYNMSGGLRISLPKLNRLDSRKICSPSTVKLITEYLENLHTYDLSNV